MGSEMCIRDRVEKSPGVMPNQEADMVDLLSARFFGKLDLLQGYWQMLLAEEAREIFYDYYSAWLVHPHTRASRSP